MQNTGNFSTNKPCQGRCWVFSDFYRFCKEGKSWRGSRIGAKSIALSLLLATHKKSFNRYNLLWKETIKDNFSFMLSFSLDLITDESSAKAKVRCYDSSLRQTPCRNPGAVIFPFENMWSLISLKNQSASTSFKPNASQTKVREYFSVCVICWEAVQFHFLYNQLIRIEPLIRNCADFRDNMRGVCKVCQ